MRVEQLDMEEWWRGDKRRFAEAFGSALDAERGSGFAVITGHRIPMSVITESYTAARRVLTLPEEKLRKYENIAGHHETGYSPFGLEYSEFNKNVGDLKHLWNVRRTLGPNNPRLLSPHYIPNVWPTEVPEFKESCDNMFFYLDMVSGELLLALEMYLDIEPGTLLVMTRDGETLMRAIHYPAIKGKTPALRSWPHTDINLITLLVAAVTWSKDGPINFDSGDSGLEVQDTRGRWLSVNETPGSIVVNSADMLKEYCRGYNLRPMHSTMHRVKNPNAGEESDLERGSWPFFVHPKGETILDPATGLTAGQFLLQRLRDIGVVADNS